MEVIVINPHSFCFGVNKALALAKKAKQEHPIGNIYLLGGLVHNERVLDSLKKDGFVLLDEKEKSLEKHISSLPNGAVMIFSAHGHPEKLDEMAKEKNLIVYDSTCQYVRDNETAIKEDLALGNEIIYIGLKGHAESLSALSLSPRVHLFASPFDEKELSNIEDSSPLLISQTTMGLEEIEVARQVVAKLFPKYREKAKCCLATEMRQSAVKEAPQDIDMFLILGSTSSNNTLKLLECAKNSHPHSRIERALDLKEAKKIDYRFVKKIALASGASTSREDFLEVGQYLENI